MPTKTQRPKALRPKQEQSPPGRESKMRPRPKSQMRDYRAAEKLLGKAAIITGADSGIGRAVAVAYAKEGADVACVYLSEHGDAKESKRLVEAEGRRCLLYSGDLGDERACAEVVARTLEELSRIDIVVNNAAEQHPQEKIQDITREQLERTFQTNVFAFFYLTREAVKHMRPGGAIINTTSVTAYRGSKHLIDYASTKGAIVAFTRSLALQLVDQGIRVNAVAPGPIWTPLIPSTFDEDKVATFGSDVPMARAGEPEEVAPAYVFLACDDSSYMTGQVLHPNGGEVVNA